MNIQEILTDFEYRFVINELRTMSKLKEKANLKVTYNSMLYLQIISHTDKCTVSYIAEKLDIAKSSVTLKVNELKKNALIEKIRDDEDRRVFYINLTEKGREVSKLFDIATEESIKIVESKFTDEEIDIFCKIMGSYLDHYYAVLEKEINLP